MTARVVHLEQREGDRAWGATAIYPTGAWARTLEQQPAAYAGDGVDVTGVQVLDEFEALSGPIVLTSATELGLVYDAMLTEAFARDVELSLGSGWPPIVVGIETGSDLALHAGRVDAGVLGPLFSEAGAGAPMSGRRGAGVLAPPGSGGFGWVDARHGEMRLEVGTLVAGAESVAVLVTDAALTARALRRLAVAAVGGLAEAADGERRFALALSTARRRGGSSTLPSGAERALARIVSRTVANSGNDADTAPSGMRKRSV